MFNFFSPKILLILSIKILLLFIFSSTVMDNIFHDVLLHFDSSTSYFSNEQHLLSYSFHSVILYLFYLSSSIVDLFAIENPMLVNVIFKLPLLLSDFLIFYILIQMFYEHRRNVFIYYFLNPMVIYATYIDPYFTIVSSSLVVLTSYLLTVRKNLNYSAIALGMAMASEIYMVIVLPIVLYYIYKKENQIEAIKYIFIALSTLLIVSLPYILNGEFIEMIRFSLRESLGEAFHYVKSFNIYISLFAFLLVYYNFFNQKQINHHLLYLYFGVLFIITIPFKVPSPELYIYMLPYLAIYFVEHGNQQKSKVFYALLTVLYLLFFMVFDHYSDSIISVFGQPIDLNVTNETIRNILYTFLEVMLLIILFAYKFSIAKNSLYRQVKNLAIGIGGDSGVGKSLLLTNLTLIFGNKILEIEGDGEHKWERGDVHWTQFTHLDPKANHIHKQAEAIYELKNHRSIYRSEYDHDTGKFTAPAKVKPKKIIVISGLHPFYLPKLRKIIDIKIYLDTDEKLRRQWKILRDTSKRGYSKEKILKQICERELDTRKYIYPQKRFADIVINYFPITEFELGEDIEIKKGLKVTFDASINIEDVLEKLTVPYLWDYNEDLKTQYIELREEPKNNYTALSKYTISNVDQIISSSVQWKHGYEGFIQFILLLSISEKLKEV